MLREKCIVLNAYIAKERSFQLKMQGGKDIKERQHQKKKNQCNKNGQQKRISETKRFSEINKTDKPLARQIKENKKRNYK